MKDEFDGIFDDLEPSDFILTTSTVQESTYPNLIYPNGQQGEEAFATFLAEQIENTRYAFSASDGKINPVGVLTNRTTRRVFTPDDDETLGMFVKRLRVEAKLLGATWFYVAQVTMVAVIDVSREVDLRAYAVDDMANVQQAERDKKTSPGVYWYAERHEDATRNVQQGIIEIVGYNLGKNTETSEQPSIIYNRVLDQAPNN